MPYHFKIIQDLEFLPKEWDHVVGVHNIFLSKAFFKVLENSKPDNMQCYAVLFFSEIELIGGALFQYLDFEKHNKFQHSTSKFNFQNIITKKFSKDTLIIGNNMLTGLNGFHFSLQKINPEEITELLEKAVKSFQSHIKKTSIIIYKDFQKSGITHFNSQIFKTYYQFSVQPNMILDIKKEWNIYEDYLQMFTKKYRDRAKTARRKFVGLEHKELNLQEIFDHQTTLNYLYKNVAGHAPFNTFFLAENHFLSLKENLKENFKIFGYFRENKLIAFYTFFCNKNHLDTYYLGYVSDLQKYHQLYLNMLLDMTSYGIKGKFEKIIFGRTALEIKSTIGAEPVPIFGLIKHTNYFINKLMPKLFPKLEPKVDWLQRKPFR